ncbi:type II secretion system protein [Candidatus Saccharibacteria bacterium]|nr:type II secretion system protein [Candidatus Saccharibacteria bacterium]
MKQRNQQKGFTIIEVVLVLAIAALIFLVVFLAVPALQRSQRDTQRRSDIGRLQTAITNYAGNHQGGLPTAAMLLDTTASGFVSKYMTSVGDKWGDPKVGTYTITNTAGGILISAAWNETTSNVNYLTNAKCNDDGTVTTGLGNRQFAIQIVLENNDLYCLGN